MTVLIGYDKEVNENKMNDRFDDVKCILLQKSICNLLRIAAVQCALRVGINDLRDNRKPQQTAPQSAPPQQQPENQSEILSEKEGVLDDFVEGDVDVGQHSGERSEESFHVDSDVDSDDSEDEDEDEDDKNRIKMVITLEDISAAMKIIRYSVSCVFSNVDSVKDKTQSKKATKRSFCKVPDSSVMDKDFLLIHRAKIQKLHQEQMKSNTGSINVSTITKNHIYPQVRGHTSADTAKKFLLGLQKHGLGTMNEDQKQFSLIDINDTENIPEDVLKLAIDIGIIKV